ncbi:hypothetical protein PHYBOEH_010464 [Phytophthora boehmeriae]|uniref:Uncharacterized protein n=1 Tax=Phytophthora boehmeriae TaxID=109152 RepID=A0A8T1VMI3_9STRA|nr:hypothetical protein PHYBOEH_010464 [Phytophthora boehmeriae]
MDLSLTDLDEHALLEDVETLLNSEVFLGPGWELVGSLSTDSENETPRSSQSWKHHIYRQRLKNEREILRLQEKEFIQQLIQLKHVQKRTTTNEKNTRPTAYFLTKAFATRQKEERLCAEAEQKSLVLAVKAQAERIKAVSSVFRKRLNQISHRNYQDQTKLEMHQELERLLFFLVQSIDWMAIKHSTFRNLYAALTSSYGAAQATMNAEMEMLTHAVNSEDNTTIIGNRNDTGMNNSSVDHYNGSSEAQTPVADKIQTKCVRRIPYNQKQKAERASLNRQVKELTKQLKILRTRKTAAKSARGRGETSDAAWETLAKRQLQARLIAEEEYRQLFQDVEERSDLIENIGMIFRKRTRAEVTSGVCSLNKTPRFKSPDVTLYEMYVNQLDEVYGQTDKLFNEILVEKSTHASNYYMESRLATHGTTYRELVGSEIAPFPFAQVQLAAMLKAMQSTTALANVTVWFSHQYDPTDDVEHYLQDLIRMHNYISAHDRQRPLRNRHLGGPELPSRSGSIYGMSRSGSVIGGDSNVSKQLMHFYASFPDTRDRNLLTKIYQTLGLARAITYCTVAQTLTFKVQKEFLDLFADGLPELRVWINWVDDLESVTSAGASIGQEGKDTAPNGAGYEVAVGFMGRTIREHCTITWLELLRPLDTPKRLEVIGAVHSLLDASNNSGLLPSTTATNVSSTLKKLGRFFETTSISVLKLLDLDSAVRRELSLLLEEFPTIVLITLFDKFNSEKMIHLVVKRGLPCFPKNDLLKMMSAVAPADTNAIEVFVATLFNFGRKKIDFLLLFLTFSSPNQLRFLDIMVVTANSALHNDPAYQLEEEEDDDAFSNDALMKGNFFLLKLFLYAHFSSADLVIHKLSTLPVELTQQLMYGVVVHSLDDFVVLGRGLETVELACLQPFLRLFFAVQLEWRETLVKLVEEMPGEETLLLYDTLLGLCSARSSNKVTTILQMLGGLDKKDKTLLCRHILVAHPETQVDQVAAGQTSTGIHARILLYLCECELSRHKVLRLLRATPFGEYDRLLSLLCTQRMPEQVVLTRLMLSIPSDVNCRILAKMSAWTAQALDAFFQLLLMLPKVEYKLFAKLMGSQYVTGEQLEMFIMVAVDMMNQASSRELVIFAAELPVHIRSLFLEMLVGQPEKGVLLRIISYSSRVAPELMHILVAQFHRMAWEIRSSFVEQLRALDASSDVENLAEFTSCLADSELLRRMVLMFNPFAIPIRVRLVTIFLQLNVHERVLALTRLVEMPKNTVSAFCAAICNPSCAPASPSFCRVMGLVDPKHHFSLLRLLNREPLWFFLRLMGEHCKHGVDEGIQADSPELLDRMAKLLEVFTAHDHHLVLKEVFREALADDMPLRDIVAVLSLFPDASRLLVFLRYANGFAKYARSSLLFRVLSKYQQSGFIFDMCRILDLDDAVFALKRLDRMWQRRHVELDKAMEPLAFRLAGGNAQVKDEFCDLIL